MITKNLPLSLIAKLSGTSYATLYRWVRPKRSTYTRTNGTTYDVTLPPKVPSFNEDGHVMLTAETVNGLIESGKISGFTL